MLLFVGSIIMKVFELFTPDQLRYKQLKSPIRRKHKELTKSTADRPHVGTGVFATVFSPEKLPGSVEKIASPDKIESLSQDGYYQYLDMLSKNGRSLNNPFFPKIHSLKTYRGSDGEYTYNVEMEQLHPLTSLSLEEIMTIGHRLFSNFDHTLDEYKKAHNFKQRYSYNPKNKSDEQNNNITGHRNKDLHEMGLAALALLFDKAIDSTRNASTTIIDSNLKKALMLIRQVVNTNPESAPDIHAANLMVRRGPFMPQVVITDPIA